MRPLHHIRHGWAWPNHPRLLLRRAAKTWMLTSVGIQVAVVAANGEEERGPLINFALRPDTAAMARDDSSDDGEANAGAGELGSMQALEGSEQLVGISHVETDAIVADEIDRHAVADLCADPDDGPIPRPGIFDGIAEQIRPHLLEHGGVALCRGQLPYLEGHQAAGRGRLQIAHRLPHSLLH